MTNFIDGISFALNSLEDFDNVEFASSLTYLLLSAPGYLRPKKYGVYKADIDVSFEGIVTTLINTSHDSKKRFDCSLSLKCGKHGGYNIHWDKRKEDPVFQLVSGYLMMDVIKKKTEQLGDFFNLIKGLVKIVKPVYGTVQSMALDGWDTPYDLKVRLPDIPSISIYGPPYIHFFGKEAILSAPFERIEELMHDYYWLEANQSVFEAVSEERRQAIREHFGEDAFMAGKKWRYQSGKSPNFDFSKVLQSKP